ncbi:hypothetical protein ACOSQ2_017449 [Xanthoceras sorbifolium]
MNSNKTNPRARLGVSEELMFWRKVDAIAEMNPEESGKILVLTSYFAISFTTNLDDLAKKNMKKGEAQKSHQERDLPPVHFSSSSPLLSFVVPHDLFQDSLADQH